MTDTTKAAGLHMITADEAAVMFRVRDAAPALLEAAVGAFLEIVGRDLAYRVEQNRWQWPDDAPDTVSIPAEQLRAAIRLATLAGDESAEQEGGGV